MPQSTSTIDVRPKRTLPLKLYATTSVGLEEVLEQEIKRIGGREVTVGRRGVAFRGNLETVYMANLWLRTAHRVLLNLVEFDAPDRKALYDGVRTVRWDEHLGRKGTLAADAVSNDSDLTHTRFIAQVIKDGIVDEFRDRYGTRPNVDRNNPDLRVSARLLNNRCVLSVDTSGERLHRRGYRPSFGFKAPLMETLAAGVVLLSEFDGSTPFVDPMCGSGTLLVEAALVARQVAPGLLGREFGFMRHPSYDRHLWRQLVELAKSQMKNDEECAIFGSDVADESLRAARASAAGAGMDDVIRLRKADIADLKSRTEGMVVVNPPYGERLGEIEQLVELYQTLGRVLKTRCTGMSAHVLSGSPYLSQKMGLKSARRDIVWNGAIKCRLLHYSLY